MADQQNAKNADNSAADPEALAASMANIAERSQALVTGFLQNQLLLRVQWQVVVMGIPDTGKPCIIGQTFWAHTPRLEASRLHKNDASWVGRVASGVHWSACSSV